MNFTEEEKGWLQALGLATGIVANARSFFLAAVSQDGQTVSVWPVRGDTDDRNTLAASLRQALEVYETNQDDGTEDSLDNQ